MDTIKDFIYLDKDYLNSYISQINDGNIISKIYTNIFNTSKLEEHIPETKEYTTNTGAETNAYIFKGNYSGNYKYTTEGTKNSFLETELGKEILFKQIHDNAFENLLSYVKAKNLLCNEQNISFNKYILTNKTFKILDLNYLISLFNNDMADIYNYILKEEFKNTEFSSNKSSKELEKTLNLELKNQGEILKYLSKMLNYINLLMPSSIILVDENFLIPLKQDYLRESGKSIFFKYNHTKLNILGKITRQYENLLSHNIENNNNVFNQIIPLINNIFASFDINLENKYIISPVAIYC